jgi:LPXTG-motif cell wall-anchored protein
VEPAAEGLDVQVLNFDDRLELRNRSDRTVTVLGYREEPYARLLPDGTVQVNRRSPSTYLNEDRFAEVELPASADAKAAPEWETLDRSGRFDWHDHRMHWMGKDLPPQVKDEGKRTKVFDWVVPIAVAGRAGEVRGDLFWVPDAGGDAPSVAPFVLGGAALAGLGLVLFVRRRRRSAATAREEAW